MSPLERRTLIALAAVGPCSNKQLADALGWPPKETYAIVKRLRSEGTAELSGPKRYDTTDRGRRIVQTMNRRRNLFAEGNRCPPSR